MAHLLVPCNTVTWVIVLAWLTTSAVGAGPIGLPDPDGIAAFLSTVTVADPMSDQTPFVDPITRDVDVGQVFAEAIALAKLVALFVAIALVPAALVFLVMGSSPLGMLLMLVVQFVLAVGTGVVLMYVVARGTELAAD